MGSTADQSNFCDSPLAGVRGFKPSAVCTKPSNTNLKWQKVTRSSCTPIFHFELVIHYTFSSRFSDFIVVLVTDGG